MNDLISRHDVLSLIDSVGYSQNNDKDRMLIASIRAKIQGIPSAEKTGKWVEDGCIEKCKDCGEQKHFPHWRFCPNCGARMIGDTE